MPPFLLPLLGLASLLVGLFAKREAAPAPAPSAPAREIHHHHYHGDPPREPETRMRRKRRVVDENPYEGESVGADESGGEQEGEQ